MKSPENVRQTVGEDGTAEIPPRFGAFRAGLVGVQQRIGSIGIIQRWGWLIALGLAIVIAGIGIGVFVLALIRAGSPDFWFDDLEVLLAATRRLFAGESWYLPRQLDGPYPTEFGDVLYPPVTAWFFAPWLVLPSWSFVAVPVGILTWHVLSARPAPWTWPLIAFGASFPISLVYAGYANPTIWIVAFVGLALRFAWPGALVLLKPSLFPFALVGIRSRGWWLCALGLGVASLPFLAETLIYPRVILDTKGGGLFYSVLGIPLMLVPVVAWLGRTREPAALR